MIKKYELIKDLKIKDVPLCESGHIFELHEKTKRAKYPQYICLTTLSEVVKKNIWLWHISKDWIESHSEYFKETK